MLKIDDIWKAIKPLIQGMTVEASYTPTWTALTADPAIGDGTISGRYLLQGKWCEATGVIRMGVTTTYGTGLWRIGLPFPSDGSNANQRWLGNAYIYDSSSSQLHTELVIIEPGFSYIRYIFGDHELVSAAKLASNTPIVWAAGDDLHWQVRYLIG